MKIDKKHMLLYAVTDKKWTKEKSLYEIVEESLKGGTTCVQLREKDLGYDDFLKEALMLRELCKRYNVPFIVNDNVQIAIDSKADGVHVGQNDMELSKVRELVGNDMIIGVSAQTLEQAITAEKNGADYLGIGAMFKTVTKQDAKYVTLDTLKQICSAVSIPVVAIGGIKQHNIMQLSGTGVDGIALISEIYSAENIVDRCQNLRTLSQKMITSKSKDEDEFDR